MEVQTLMGWGDEIMASGHARKAQEKDPRRVVILDRSARPRWHGMWLCNPRISIEQTSETQCIVNGPNVRPYIKSKSQTKWEWIAGTCERGEIYFNAEERSFADALQPIDVVIEPNTKPTAPINKSWDRSYWLVLIELLKRAGLQAAQLGPVGTRPLPGARWIQTPNFRYACAALSRARAAVLPEGGLHHAAAALSIKAVVIFGGYISPEVTGYPEQASLFVGKGLGCGQRFACQHCQRAMNQIEPIHAFKRLEAML